MLQLRNICKSYTTGNFTQKALDNVSVSFRDNEFVAILGPSGSGKTTLLNIVGGLDHYDSGDLVIDGVSTKKYKDRDWDTYRNNRIGFVFQSYNLIPHQTVLANVELALTLSGVSRTERRERAREALERVGLGEHMDKKPSQMSGGQMQRVAIARALINDPEILLADEPTGALDSKTSVQIMDLLTEIAEDRLVVMVTHNPELAEEYATRIINLADGVIRSDTDPYEPTQSEIAAVQAKPPRRTSMSFLTALSLSANNLMTKKGRTIMTAIAGSIGIIGIAAILSLANGVNNYIKTVEEETLSVYPLQIMSTGFDFTTMLVGMGGASNDDSEDADSSQEDSSLRQEITGELGEGEIGEARMISRMFASFGNNDLAALKEYFDSGESDIDQYVSSIYYEYAVTPQIFDANTKKGVRQVNPDTSFSSLGIGSGVSSNSIMSMSMSTDMFSEMMESDVVANQYDVVAGHWPEKDNELVLVLSQTGRISDFMSYVLGLRDAEELKKMVKQFTDEEEVDVDDDAITIKYDDVLGMKFKLVNAVDYYKHDAERNVWIDKSDDKKFMKKAVEAGEDLVIAGIVRPKPEANALALTMGLYYPQGLTRHIVKNAANSEIVKDQLAHPKIDVFSGKSFDDLEDEKKDEFDMSSLFTIDEDAIQAAFKFDASAFDMSGMDFSKLDLSGMDMSNMDFSSLDLSQLDFSGMDFSQLDFSQLDLPQLDPSTMNSEDFDPSKMGIEPPDLSGISLDAPEVSGEKIRDAVMPGVTDEQLAEALRSVDVKVTDQDALNSVAADLGKQYALWQVANPKGSVTDFLAQTDLTGYIDKVVNAVDTQDIAHQLNQKLADLMNTSEDNVNQELVNRVFSAYIEQMPESTKQQLRDIMSKYTTEMISKYITEVLAPALTNNIGTSIQDAVKQYADAISAVLQKQIASMMEKAMGELATTIGSAIGSALQQAMGGFDSGSFADSFANAFSFDEDAFAKAFKFDMDEEELTELMMSMMRVEEHSYDNNLKKLGYAEFSKPSEISIYPLDFESKEHVIQILDGYNDRMRSIDEDKVISYTDLVGTLMDSVTTIVNMISYVLIAFVAISLIVSSIMIGVITYISVLERKKEIGILRSIGASKGDISRVFNAETVIEGLIAGLLGVGTTALCCIPANAIVYSMFDVPNVALLPPAAAGILVAISVFLTFVAGLIPSRSASRKDPVEALRSE